MSMMQGANQLQSLGPRVVNSLWRVFFVFEGPPGRCRYRRNCFAGELKGSLKHFAIAWRDPKGMAKGIEIEGC